LIPIKGCTYSLVIFQDMYKKRTIKRGKEYTYSHACPGCKLPLTVRFVYNRFLKQSVGYCVKCRQPAIVGKSTPTPEIVALILSNRV